MTAWIADVLIVLGLIVMTLGVYGIVRFPDVYTRLHASSKAALLGVSVLLVPPPLAVGRPCSPASCRSPRCRRHHPVAHAIAQAAYHQREPMRAPAAIDESGTMPPSTAAPLQRHHLEDRPGS